MSTDIPHPANPAYAAAYGHAWRHDPVLLTEFFAADGSYTDVAMRGTYTGRGGIRRFHRWMVKFAPDSLIVFAAPAVQDGRAYFEWTWSGSITGALRLPGGDQIDAAGRHFSVEGIADCRYGSAGTLTSSPRFLGYRVADRSARLHALAAAAPQLRAGPKPGVTL